MLEIPNKLHDKVDMCTCMHDYAVFTNTAWSHMYTYTNVHIHMYTYTNDVTVNLNPEQGGILCSTHMDKVKLEHTENYGSSLLHF